MSGAAEGPQSGPCRTLGSEWGEGGRAEGTRLKKENVETEMNIITEFKGEKRKREQET